MAGSQSKNVVGGACFRPTSALVVAAIESLYADELIPFGRILLKRVGELAADIAAKDALSGKTTYGYVSTDVGHLPLIDPKHLMRVCRQCPRLRVEFVDSGEYVAMLVGCPPTFVDSSSTEDPYPAELWADLVAYFAGPADAQPPLPAGRYNSARALQARGLPFLEGRSLGEVCHILALAMSQRKILGHCKGHTVPYARSESGHKEFCASAELPVVTTKVASAGMPFASWEQVLHGLQALLAESSDRGALGIPMPNVKRLFRSRLGLELSETALGHSRVQDLLQDERLHGVCQVRRCGPNNICYVTVRQPDDVPPPPGLPASCAAPPRELGPPCAQPSPLRAHPLPGLGAPQPAYITPTLLESIQPLGAKWAGGPRGVVDEGPRGGRSGPFGLDPAWASRPCGLEADLTPWDRGRGLPCAGGPPGLLGGGLGRASAAHAA